MLYLNTIIMENSTFSNKTEVEELLTSGELSESYYLLVKQYENLSTNYEALKLELQDTKRNYQNAMNMETQLNMDFETYQVEEQKLKDELLSRIKNLQEDISELRNECSQMTEQNVAEIKELEMENLRLKEEETFVPSTSPERDNKEINEIRNKLSSATSDSAAAKAALEEAKTEIESWRLKIKELVSEVAELRAAAEIRREEMRNFTEREATVLADLAEARAMLHQLQSVDLEPHAAKGNSVFAEVEDKRQEMVQNLIQMKQTNARLRRDLANKQTEADALLHEKQTVWAQQISATTEYDREIIENYEDCIAQLEELCDRQWCEINRWLGKLSENSASGWQPGIIEHLKTEREKLRAEVLAKGAAELASAAQVRELRRKLTLQTINIHKQSPLPDSPDKSSVTVYMKPNKINLNKVGDIKKKVSFN